MNASRDKTHHRLLIAAILMTAIFSVSRARAADAPVLLENDSVLLQCDPVCGTIVRILDKSSGIELASPRELAENFRLHLLLPDGKIVTIFGKDQKLTSSSRTADGLALDWQGPLKDESGKDRKISVLMNITAAGNELTFNLHLENAEKLKVKEVLYPMIGGLSKFGLPGKPSDGTLWAPTSAPWIKRIEPAFAATFGYPGQMCMSFTCIESASAGKSLYFASHDKLARYKVYRFEEHTKEVAGNKAQDLFACIQHHPFTPSGRSFDGSAVVLRVVDGDWRAAGKVYRAWFEKTFGVSKPADCWIRRESFFLITMFGLPEGTICLRFRDIPQWAKAAKEHGVNSVQISGWQHGGHDNGYPDYTPDPRLGTWKELEDGIKACHAMGMKVYFFANYQPIMIDSDWYKRELGRYREWGGPNGELTWNTGWGMGTLWARMDHPKKMTWADPAFPQFRKIIVDQFAKLAEIGADGVHIDKMFPSNLDFNPDLPMSSDAAGWEGAIVLSKEINEACRKLNPAWAMSFECNWDRLLQFSGATWWVGNQRITRSVFPENVEATSISSAYDYLGVNNLVRDGHVVMLAPRTFAGGMDWKPWEGLADYIKGVKRIRDELQETVFYGEVLGHDGVTLGDVPPGVEYTVFRNLASGKRVCILTNSKLENAKQSILGFDGRQGAKVRVHVPNQETKTFQLPAEIDVPAERIVFVEER